MIVVAEVKKIYKILKELKVDFYFHAGFGLYLHGFESELDDCDIRVFHPSIREVYRYVKKRSSDQVKLRGIATYASGIYDNECVEVLNETSFDICSEMVANCDVGEFHFPFSKEVFRNIDWIIFSRNKITSGVS